MIFVTSELANKAEIAILSARDTTRAWVPGRGIMGRNVGVYKKGYNTWLSSRPQNQPRSFRRSFYLIFSLFSSFFFRYHASSPVGSSFSRLSHAIMSELMFSSLTDSINDIKLES